jgi:hypothetical protein
MPIEIKGNQLRIRVRNPQQFSAFRTQDVGSKGKMERIAGMKRGDGWMTQAWRFNLGDYAGFGEVKHDILSLKDITKEKKATAIKKARGFFY